MSILCFLSVAKHLSFSKAAEEVFISRQAVSKKILSLEESLGVRLFERTTATIELTAEGKLYQDLFQKFAREFEMLSETIGNPGKSMVHLVIGYELGLIVDKRIIEFIREYKRKKENVEFKIRRFEPHTIDGKLLNGQLDIAFTTIHKGSKISLEFPYIAIEQTEFVLATSIYHPKVNENTVVSDFDGEQAVYWNWNVEKSDDIICRKNYSSIWSDIGITVIPSVQCTSLSSAYTELLMGNAVLLCHSNSEFCTFPDIITFPLPKKEIFGCVWRPDAPPEIKEFAEALMAIFDSCQTVNALCFG